MFDAFEKLPRQILTSTARASKQSLMAEVLNPAYAQTEAETKGKESLERMLLVFRNALVDLATAPDGRPRLVADVEENAYQEYEHAVLVVFERFRVIMEGNLTVFGRLLQNMAGPVSTDPALREVVDQLHVLLHKLRQEATHLQEQYAIWKWTRIWVAH
jgi:hypothetical protein